MPCYLKAILSNKTYLQTYYPRNPRTDSLLSFTPMPNVTPPNTYTHIHAVTSWRHLRRIYLRETLLLLVLVVVSVVVEEEEEGKATLARPWESRYLHV